jgi:CBS domain containing-hemolysin-like protein
MIPMDVALVIAGLCLAAEVFFAGAEKAIVSCDRALLHRKAGAGDRGARLTLDFLERPDRFLATTLLGTKLSIVTSTTVVTLALLGGTAGRGEVLAVAILTPILIVCGEIVPKALCQQHADAVAPVVVVPLRFASIALGPAVYLLGRFAAWVARRLGVEERRALVTRDELRTILDPADSATAAAIPEAAREMISNVLDFGDRTVYDVMVPLSEVAALPEATSLEEASAEVAEKQHTRVPVYRDRVDQIVGVLHAHDLLVAETQGRKGTIAEIARPPVFVPESKPTGDMLIELQQGGHQLAIVVDEYGGATGVCSIEDILEEIVGEIEDEYDRGPSPIRPEGPGLWRVLARTSVSQVNGALKIDLPEGEDYESIAGLLLDRLKRIPREGESVKIGNATLTIVGASDRAIEEVRIRVGKKR